MKLYMSRNRFPVRGEFVTRRGEDGREYVYIRCPECNEIVCIDPETHHITVSRDGLLTVCPSVVCPMDGCSFHGWIENSEVKGA